jgi:DNA end-binding protein Ku
MRGQSTQLSFGPVTFPCKLFSAHESAVDKLCNVHTTCGGPLAQKKWCPACQAEAIETQKGFKLNSKNIVPLTEAELDGLPVKSQKEVEILQFFSEPIDARLHGEHTYYLGNDGKAKAYTLLLTAMEKAHVKALARFRKSLYVIEPFQGVLMMQEIIYIADLRDPGEVRLGIEQGMKRVVITEKEQGAVGQLIGGLTAKLELGAYGNAYSEALEALVEAKMAGRSPIVASTTTAQPSNEDNLIDEIMAYLNKGKAQVKTVIQPEAEVVPLVLGATPDPVEAEPETIWLPWGQVA